MKIQRSLPVTPSAPLKAASPIRGTVFLEVSGLRELKGATLLGVEVPQRKGAKSVYVAVADSVAKALVARSPTRKLHGAAIEFPREQLRRMPSELRASVGYLAGTSEASSRFLTFRGDASSIGISEK